jgi:EAL domain-containing protein (putative c-di-GMP-specific phosphodiesterase class I)/DNA-binding NarL/FixJ family response regulator
MNISDLNVLIVEDDDFQRGVLASMLESLGVTAVFKAGNGREALEIVRGAGVTPINVALCDLNMPEMDGMELLRHLGEECQNVAVILTSSLDGKLLASVGRMARMYGIPLLGTIEKPVLLASLKGLLLKYDAALVKVHQPSAYSFTLEEIVRGIQANQFEPYFQPKVDMKSGRVVGAEALARWKHPEHGVVGPYAFIPQLEQTDNIIELTFLMLRKSAEACRSLHARGHLLSISVNLSPILLGEVALADKVAGMVREAGIEPQYIVLEITESAAMTNVATALENLARLCMNGFALSIDDYGTGSSNLQQLMRIAFSELKIDQSFVTDFAENNALRIVVESSIDMARKLQVKSVAEGVEVQQEWDILKSIGCDIVQGYFIAKPMEIDAFDNFVVHYKCPSALTSPSALQAIQNRSLIKILVLEDDDFTRMIILRVLHDIGFINTVDVKNALSAIKQLESNVFDLIVTDVNMPGMNGLRFVQLIRAGKTLAKPDARIVVQTMFSQTEILGTALALDVNGFLVKPIVPAVVEEKLMRALTEFFHPRSPIAYEAVRTELERLPHVTERKPEILRRAYAVPGVHKTQSSDESSDARTLPLSRLRPGMILKENVHLKDGTLILSLGHPLTELSINRLNDLKELLPTDGIAAQ